MDLDTSQVIAAVIGSNALFAFIQFLITRHDQKKNALSKHEKAQNDMIIGLGHDKLLYLTDKFVQRGGVTLKERLQSAVGQTRRTGKLEEMVTVRSGTKPVKNYRR